MKKILILLTVLSNTAIFANDCHSHNNVLENRIENNLNYKFKLLKDESQTLKIKDYDVEVYGNYINIEAEATANPNNFNFLKAFAPIKEEIIKEAGANIKINVIVEYDKAIGHDEIIFNEDL